MLNLHELIVTIFVPQNGMNYGNEYKIYSPDDYTDFYLRYYGWRICSSKIWNSLDKCLTPSDL